VDDASTAVQRITAWSRSPAPPAVSRWFPAGLRD